MRALILCGSRRGGFTSSMCESFASGLNSENIETEIIYPIELDINHCTGCGYCSKNMVCNIEDDMKRIYEMFEKADLLILSSPVRFSGPSSVIKIVIDRFQPFWYCESQHPLYVLALMNGGGKHPEFKNLTSVFKAFSITIGMKWMGDISISDTDSNKPDFVRDSAYRFGKETGITLNSENRV
jgi:Multimeric flavodoxin WrbA